MDIHITKGNMKLPTTTLNFSLPPVMSCPGSTEACRKHCYAKKAYRQYPSTKTAWDENFELSRTATFVQDVKDFLNKKRKWEAFRIHTSGDMYNQSYLDKWIEIAKAYPTKIFYTYTKVRWLDFSKRPSNFIVLLSDDDKTMENDWYRFNGVAVVSKEKVESKKGWTVCSGSCKTCDACFTNPEQSKRIIFNVH